MNSPVIYDVLIVGAGISGISAGNYLSKNNLKVKILDKGKSPGGRMATRRIDSLNGIATFDYGCRFITAGSYEFSSEMMELINKGVAAKWNIRSQNTVLDEISNNMKIIGKRSIRDIAIELSKNLDISNQTKVTKISWDDYWEVTTDNKEVFRASVILLTMPVPQIIQLFNLSKITIDENILQDLKKVKYQRNIVGMFITDSPSKIGGEGGLKFNEDEISFITDNNLKGVNHYKNAVSIEMSDKFSRENWNLPDYEIINKIISSAGEWIGADIIKSYIHRWKYSIPVKSYPKKFEYIDKPGPIYLAGDAFGGNSVEASYLSGFFSAKSLISKRMLIKDLVK